MIVASVEAPATPTGFKIRLHLGTIIKVDPQQPKAGVPVTFAVDPSSSPVLMPVANHPGFFTGKTDGVVTVKVTQAGALVGTLAVTVWS